MDTQLVTKQIHLQQWAEMVRACKNSGLNTREWCRQNGIGIKTYYYRFNRLKEEALEAGMFAELIPSEHISAPRPEKSRPHDDYDHKDFIPQMTISVKGATLGISEHTPDSLILKMMEMLDHA